MPTAQDIAALIRVLETQRTSLGDAAVDFAIAALKDNAATGETAQKLRQVTILFCDIVDSTSKMESLSAEDALHVINPALSAFSHAIRSHGGKVLRYTGDGFKAAFGVDATSEDDAERAVRAGLALLDIARRHADDVRWRYGIPAFEVRVGINTGAVMLGGGVEADSTAIGHAVNIAARMEQSAPIGKLRIAHATWVHVRGLFDVESQPPMEMKGSSEPLVTYLVLGEAARRFDVVNRGLDGAESRMVGRDDELASLLSGFERARTSCALESVSVVGDAGVGKSRLLHEFVLALDARRGSGGASLRARARPSGSLQPYGLLRELIAGYCGITDDASADFARQRLVDGLAPLFDDDSGPFQAQLIGRLIGLDFPEEALAQEVVGQELRTRGFKALTRVMASLAQRAPAGLLILIDDLHWADDASLDFITELVQSDLHAAITFAMASRPMLFDRRTDWMRNVARHVRLDVLPLSALGSLTLASQLLAKLQERDDAIERLVIERAEGNPYFMEELVRMLIDDGVIDTRELPWTFRADRLRAVRVPGTLTGTLQARLDALVPAHRQALQNASIIGSVFWDAALAAIHPAAPRALPHLTRRALVDARDESAFEGTVEHVFHHQLLHDVTYSTVLRAMREHGHARAAEWLASRIGDRAGEFLGLTAEHFERAGNRVSALDYYVRAADDADARIANSSALAYIDRALALVSSDDPMLKHYLLDRRYSVVDRTSNQSLAAETLAMIAQHAEACDSDWMRASLLARRSIHADRSGDATQAEAIARQGLPLAEASGNASAAALIHGELGWLAISRRDFALAERHIADGVPWARRAASAPLRECPFIGYELRLCQIGITSLLAQERYAEAITEIGRAFSLPTVRARLDRMILLQRRSGAHGNLGLIDLAARDAQEMVSLAREFGIPRLENSALRCLADVAEFRGDYPEMLRCALEAKALATRIGDGYGYASCAQYEGVARLELGQFEEALAAFEEARAGNALAGEVGWVLHARACMADVLRRAGDQAGAIEAIQAVLRDSGGIDSLMSNTQFACWKVLRGAGSAHEEIVAQLQKALQGQLKRLLSQIPDDDGRARVCRNVPQWRDFLKLSSGPADKPHARTE